MGSPRLDGNTAKVFNLLKEKVSNFADCEILNLAMYNVNGCKGCMGCQSDATSLICNQNDDVCLLLKKIVDADVILYGTPLYGHSYSGQLKLFLDRHTALFKFVAGKSESVDGMEIKSLIKDKLVGLVVCCQGPEANNTELVQMLFDKFCESSLTKCLGKYIFSLCSENSKNSNLSIQVIDCMINDIVACCE